MRPSRVAILVIPVGRGKRPTSEAPLAFRFLASDDEGCDESSAFDRHQRARAELALAIPCFEHKGHVLLRAEFRLCIPSGRFRCCR